MAYDIHIAKSKKVAQQNNPVLSIEIEEHELVFLVLAKNGNKYPMFQSMEDYYRDTTYYNTAIDNLSSELESLIQNESNKNTKELAEKLLKIAFNAKEQSSDIYCFCD